MNPEAVTTEQLVRIEEVRQFLYHEARCLERPALWPQWLDLFGDDGHYWIPYSQEQTDSLDTPSIVYEDKVLLAIRLARLEHPNAWAQHPQTRTCRIISNVTIESRSLAGELVVLSNLHMWEYRLDRYVQYAANCTHHLVRWDGGFRIKLKRVDLVSGDGVYENIIQILP